MSNLIPSFLEKLCKIENNAYVDLNPKLPSKPMYCVQIYCAFNARRTGLTLQVPPIFPDNSLQVGRCSNPYCNRRSNSAACHLQNIEKILQGLHEITI